MAVNELQMEELKPFGIFTWEEAIKEQGTPAINLLNDDQCRSFLTQYMHEINAPNLRVTASLFMKQYARITIAAALYQISLNNAFVSLPIESCLFGKDRKLHIKQNACDWNEWEADNRKAWLHSVLHPMFARHLTPMIVMLQRTSKLSSKILWENAAVRINSFYRQLLKEELSQTQSDHVIADFNFLKEASGDLFQLKENPLAPFLHLDTETCTRRTCCMYYLMDKNEYCGVCPLTKNPSS
ncbi:IucA/IucC family C-terminal-domain containing protein [Alkalicoccobacillus plakortidis]|uniref:(2Fe-2S)-binding protein n=1 Tax=Alkalicoccobacillus plakortidis TaxID=444060 RepID=A0ABT0XK73_9BACI|nr:IucA/IucC family C-terminal-domain containing protein [Alkalicoccobacillus plakortidis]MCM2676298.1 (2Fe-2S)-binding protein [Alkalicoccobacillus plakortidis]